MFRLFEAHQHRLFQLSSRVSRQANKGRNELQPEDNSVALVGLSAAPGAILAGFGSFFINK